MRDSFKTNPLYIKLKDRLKEKYKNNFEDNDDFIFIYHKSMTFCVEAYEGDTPDSFIVIGALNSIELSDGDTRIYNDLFTLHDMTISTEDDIDIFLDEFCFMVKDTDADKRCVRILKAIDKLRDMIGDDSYDRDFLIDSFHNEFGMC